MTKEFWQDGNYIAITKPRLEEQTHDDKTFWYVAADIWKGQPKYIICLGVLLFLPLELGWRRKDKIPEGGFIPYDARFYSKEDALAKYNEWMNINKMLLAL